MSDEPKKRSRAWIGWALVAMPIVYVGAYYAMVVWPGPPACGPGPLNTYYEIFGHPLPIEAQTFFKPIHLLDRKLRPEKWWLENVVDP
jgi:hypothetical protein